MIIIKVDGENNDFGVEADITEKDLEKFGPVLGQTLVSMAEYIAQGEPEEERSKTIVALYDAFVSQIKDGGSVHLRRKGYLDPDTIRISDML